MGGVEKRQGGYEKSGSKEGRVDVKDFGHSVGCSYA